MASVHPGLLRLLACCSLPARVPRAVRRRSRGRLCRAAGHARPPRGVGLRLLGSPARGADDAHRRPARAAAPVRGVALVEKVPWDRSLFDVRHGVRALVNAPVFTAVTVLTLALGIGANSAIFSLVNAVLLRPLGYERAGAADDDPRGIPESSVPRFGVSPADYLDLSSTRRAFTDIGAYRTRPSSCPASGDPESIAACRCRLPCSPCSASMRPRAGRSCRRRIRPSAGRRHQRAAAPPPLRGIVADRRARHDSIGGRTRSSA